MEIVLAIIIFSVSSLLINVVKINTQFLLKKWNNRNNKEYLAIVSEMKQIDKTIKGYHRLSLNKYIIENFELIDNTKIIKRYRKTFSADEIPISVYFYSGLKVKEILDKKIKESKQYKSYSNKPNNIFDNFSNSEYYEILGVEKNDTFDVIKKKYRTEMKTCHPDKLEGMSEPERLLGEEKSKKINEAYEYFTKKNV